MGDTTPKKAVEDLLELYTELLIPFMKIRRDMPFPTEPERQETDGEHTFMLAILVVTLAEKFDPTLDTGLIARYALVHDLVEVYAGDVSVRSADYHNKHIREEAAVATIKKRFSKQAPWIVRDIEAYEKRADRESRFVYATDKLMGGMARVADNGASWADYYPEKDGSGFHRAVGLLRRKAELYPDLLPVFDELHDMLDKSWPNFLGLEREQEA